MPEISSLREFLPAISVGVLAGDLGSLQSQTEVLEDAGVRMLHFDVMDGCFTPMLTFGAPVVASIRTTLFKDVHLMVNDPLDKVDAFIAAGANLITVHIESCTHIHRVLQRLGTAKVARGIALNPGTPVESVEPLLDELEFVLLLAVNPGWGGQKLIESTWRRVPDLQNLIKKCGGDILIGVDGGLDKSNIHRVAAAGVDVLVTGSAVFEGGNTAANARFMLQAVSTSHPGAPAKGMPC